MSTCSGRGMFVLMSSVHSVLVNVSVYIRKYTQCELWSHVKSSGHL